jgi:pimeloyl-ACP methyl ester carboxylesterase
MTAPPVVLVHGFASNFEHDWRRTGWVDILEAEGRTVLGVDLPGHGPAAGETGLTPMEAVQAVAGAGPVDAIGFSAGGHALLGAAAGHPETFRRVALLGVGSLDDNTAESRASGLAAELESDEEPVDQFGRIIWRLAESSGNDRRVLARVLRSDRGERPTREALRGLELPVLLVVGDQDVTGSGRELAGMLPRARLLVLRGVDHFATLGDLRCIEAVVEFLTD